MPDTRPNILLVFTDQQRADTLGALNPVMRTPVMDRLCAETISDVLLLGRIPGNLINPEVMR